MTRDRVDVPLISPATGWRWRRAWPAALTLVLVLGVCVHTWVSEPADRPFVLAGVTVLAGVLAYLADRQSWIDTGRGVVVQRVLHLVSVEVRWSATTVLRFRCTRLGMVMLQVRGHRWWSIYLPIVAADGLGIRCQPLALLWQVVDEMERWVPEQAGVIDELQRQIAHLEAGGAVLDSPLLVAYHPGWRRRG